MLLYRSQDRDMQEAYMHSEPSHFKDFAFFLSKLHVKDLGETFKINVPDVVLFYKTEPVLKIFCTDPFKNQVQLERERDKLQLLLIDSFFKKRNEEDSKLNLKPFDDSKSRDKSEKGHAQAPRILKAYFSDVSRDGKKDLQKSGSLPSSKTGATTTLMIWSIFSSKTKTAANGKT